MQSPPVALPPDAVIVADGHAYTTSTAVAQVFGRKHFNVLRDIDGLECTPEFHALNFECMPRDVPIGNGATRKDREFRITRDGLTFLAFGYTGRLAAQFKEAYIARFNEMEAAFQAPARVAELQAIEARALALLDDATRRHQGAQRIKREAKTAWLQSVERDTALTQAHAEIARLTAQLRQAQALALAADARLAPVLHYARKDLNAQEVSRLTDLPEATVTALLDQLTGAGIDPGPVADIVAIALASAQPV